MRCQYMTFKCDEIASFASLPADAAGQPPAKFDRAASDLLYESTRLNILCCNRGPIRGSPGTVENHIARCRKLQSSFNTKTSLDSFMWITFVEALHSSKNIRLTKHTVAGGLSSRFVQSPLSTHSQERQVEFRNHVAALPHRGGKTTHNCVKSSACSPNCNCTG